MDDCWLLLCSYLCVHRRLGAIHWASVGMLHWGLVLNCVWMLSLWLEYVHLIIHSQLICSLMLLLTHMSCFVLFCKLMNLCYSLAIFNDKQFTTMLLRSFRVLFILLMMFMICLLLLLLCLYLRCSNDFWHNLRRYIGNDCRLVLYEFRNDDMLWLHQSAGLLLGLLAMTCRVSLLNNNNTLTITIII